MSAKDWKQKPYGLSNIAYDPDIKCRLFLHPIVF